MTAAAQKLLTWKAASGDASKKWRLTFETMLDKGKTKNYKDSDWKDAVKDATSDLTKEMADALDAVTKYGELMGGFHETAHERMANAMRMAKALADPKNPPPPGLMQQAKGYVDEILEDLKGPVKTFLSMSKDLQGNRLDLFKEADVTNAIKEGSKAPKNDLVKLLNDYKAKRKLVIDKSNEITLEHKNKVTSYETRAKDIVAQLAKFEKMGGMERDDIKKDLAKDLKEMSDFLISGNDGNLVKMGGRALGIITMSKTLKSKDPVKLKVILKDYNDITFEGDKKAVSIQVIAWKNAQKKLELLEAYAKKLNNDTLSGKVKKLSAIGAKNQKLSDALKAAMDNIAEHYELIRNG